jgi:hypothetical protein
MNPAERTGAGWFFLRVLGLGILVTCVWYPLSGPYERLLVSAAAPLIQEATWRRYPIVIAWRPGEIVLSRPAPARTRPTRYRGHNLHFNAIPFTALMLATPILGLRRKAGLLVAGLLGLAVIHVSFLLVSAIYLSYLAVGSQGAARIWSQLATWFYWTQGRDVVPIVLWAVLGGAAWLGDRRRAAGGMIDPSLPRPERRRRHRGFVKGRVP